MSSGDRFLDALDLACSLDSEFRICAVRCVPEGVDPDELLGTLLEDRMVERERHRYREALVETRERRGRRRIDCTLTLGRELAEYGLSLAATGPDGALTVIAIRRTRADASERRLLATLDRIHAIILGSNDVEEMLSGVLDAMLEIFDCDRAWLLYPCDPAAETFTVPMERTRPQWPGAGVTGEAVPMDEFARMVFATALERPGAHRFDVESGTVDPDDWLIERFHIRSQMVIAIRPDDGTPWCMGIHHCAAAHDYTDDAALFEAISARIADALRTLLAQDRLRRSEDRFRTLVEHAPEAIVICDAETMRFVDTNRNAERLYGLSHAELLCIGPMETSPEFQPNGERSIAVIEREVGRALAGEVPAFEWTHVNSRGEQIPCEVRLVRLPDPNRQLVRGSVTDISQRHAGEVQRRELEAQLRQSQKMEAIGQLTGGVAHDFNNILTAILGNTELALDGLQAKDPAHELLGEVLTSIQRGATLTQRLLAFSRKQALVPRAIDLGELIQGMEAMLVRTLGEAVQIEVVAGAGLWPCEADPVQLESAILNLAINARDAMPAGGRLTIEASNKRLDDEYCDCHGEVMPGQFAMLAVSDDGVGMTAEVLGQAFDPFFTTKDVGKGSGLGLSMVYGFVKQSRGHIKLYSELGHGTVAKLYLPRATKATRDWAEPESERAFPRGRGESILVVEDDPAVRAYVVAALQGLGYRAHQTPHALAALELLSGDTPVDLMLTDVVLPGGMNGVELARRAHRSREGLLVLYMSGYTENAIIHHGRLDPGIELLSKPFSKAELARRVRDVLDQQDG